MNLLRASCVAFLFTGCFGDPPDDATDDAGKRDTIDYIVEDMPPEPAVVGLIIEDMTQPGEGLPLDAVELCNVVGQGCVLLEVLESTGTTSDYSGATDGANAQNGDCVDGSFTRMTPGDTVSFGKTDTALDSTAKVNIWIGTSDCPAIAAGGKPFRVSVVDEAGTTHEVETCEGTCTITVP